MTKAEFNAAVKSILDNLSDQAAASESLTKLYDAFSEVSANNEQLNSTNTQLETDNENLRKANLRLFSRLGEQNVSDKEKEEDKEEETKPMKFEDLFNEKGELK